MHLGLGVGLASGLRKLPGDLALPEARDLMFLGSLESGRKNIPPECEGTQNPTVLWTPVGELPLEFIDTGGTSEFDIQGITAVRDGLDTRFTEYRSLGHRDRSRSLAVCFCHVDDGKLILAEGQDDQFPRSGELGCRFAGQGQVASAGLPASHDGHDRDGTAKSRRDTHVFALLKTVWEVASRVLSQKPASVHAVANAGDEVRLLEKIKDQSIDVAGVPTRRRGVWAMTAAISAGVKSAGGSIMAGWIMATGT